MITLTELKVPHLPLAMYIYEKCSDFYHEPIVCSVISVAESIILYLKCVINKFQSHSFLHDPCCHLPVIIQITDL